MKIRTIFAPILTLTSVFTATSVLRSGIGILLGLCLSTPVLSDISLTYQSMTTPEHQSTILVNNNFIRFENPMAPEFFMLYDVKRQRMTLVDSISSNYTTLDRESLEGLSEQIEVTRQAIIAELEAGIRNAAPEEKQQMAEILEQIKSLAQPPLTELVQYKALANTLEINGYSCKQVQALIKHQEQAILCVIDAEQANIPITVMSTLNSFHLFSSSIHQQLSPGDATELLFVMKSQTQLPVSIHRTQPASAEDEYRLTQIQNLTIPADRFKVPKGYQAKDIENAFIVD